MDSFELRACLASRCLCSQNIDKSSNKPAIGYKRIIQDIKKIWLLYNLVSLKNRFRLINAVKPHTMKVSLLVMDPLKNLIITGSEDKSLFFFKFLTSDKGIDMDPIRCVTLDFVAINFEWLSSKVIYYTYISKYISYIKIFT